MTVEQACHLRHRMLSLPLWDARRSPRSLGDLPPVSFVRGLGLGGVRQYPSVRYILSLPLIPLFSTYPDLLSCRASAVIVQCFCLRIGTLVSPFAPPRSPSCLAWRRLRDESVAVNIATEWRVHVVARFSLLRELPMLVLRPVPSVARTGRSG